MVYFIVYKCQKKWEKVYALYFNVLLFNSGKEHNPPHFHVKYNGDFSVFDLEGNLIEGNLPLSKQKLVSAWAEIHKDELRANWDLCLNRDTLFKINPLQ